MTQSLSCVEISAPDVIKNIKAFQKFLGNKIKIAAVIKGNAYGHGQNEIAQILEPYTDYFLVDDLRELLLLRKVSTKPVLVFGYVPKNEIKEVLENNGILAIYDIERLRVLNKIAQEMKIKPKIHIKIDACLGRQGILLKDLNNFLTELKRARNVECEAVYTHFANTEDTDDCFHALKQINVFARATKLFEKNGFKNFKKHFSSTSGVLLYEKEKLKSEIVRIGIGLYGMWPSSLLKKRFGAELKIKPAMRWITKVAQIKTLPSGYTVGYGLTYRTSRATKVAVVPQGYSDGYDRKLSNCGEVLIRGQRCRILGRVAMNMFVVDISKIKNIIQEDEVVLLGEQKKYVITAEEIAEKIGTINYEITSRISPLLPRKIKGRIMNHYGEK